MSNLFENCSNYLFKNKHILLLLFLLPPLLWLGIIYLGSLIVFLFHSFFYLDGFTGKIVYKISLRTIAELFNSPANLDILIIENFILLKENQSKSLSVNYKNKFELD